MSDIDILCSTRTGMDNRKTAGSRPIRKCRIREKIEQSQRIAKDFLNDSESTDPPKKKTLDLENELIFKKWKIQMAKLKNHKENLRKHIFEKKCCLERSLLIEIQSEITLQTKAKQPEVSVRQSVLYPQTQPPVQTHRIIYCLMPVSKNDGTTTPKEDFRRTCDTMKIKQEIDNDTCINECVEWRGACQGNKISHDEVNKTVIKKEIDFELPSNQRVDEREKDDRSGEPNEIHNNSYTNGTLQCSINDETKCEPFTKDKSEEYWKIVKNTEWNNNLCESKLKAGNLEYSNKENVLEYHYYPEDEDVDNGWKVVLNPEWEED